MEDKFKVLRNAERFVVNRQFDRAISEYQQLVQTHGEDPSVLNTLGDLFLRSGRRGEALDCFRRVAEIFVQSGFVAKGIALYRKIEELNPGSREVLGKLGELYERRGLRSEAARWWHAFAEHLQGAADAESLAGVRRRIVELDPESPAARVALARVLADQSRGEATEEYLVAARLYLEKGGLTEARDAALKALELDRTNREAKRLFGETEERLAAEAAAEAAAFAADEPPPAESAEWEASGREEAPREEEVDGAWGEATGEASEPLKVEAFEEGSWEEAVAADEPPPAESAGWEASGREEAPREEEVDGAREEATGEASEPLKVEAFEEGVWDEAFGADESPHGEHSPWSGAPAAAGEERESVGGSDREFREEVPAPLGDIDFGSAEEAPPPLEDGGIDPFQDESLPSYEEEFRTATEDSEETVLEGWGLEDGETVPEASSRSEADEWAFGEVPDGDAAEPREIPDADSSELLDTAPEPSLASGAQVSDERAPDDVLQEIDFYLKLELIDDARRLTEDLMGQYPLDKRIQARAEKVGLLASSSVESEAAASFELEVDAALEGLFFEEEAAAGRNGSDGTADLSVGDSRHDPRAQYDLGLAYREMNMLEDAVAKFEQAYHLFSDAENPEQALLCSSMLASGYLKLRNFGKTVEWADIGLSLPNMKEFEWKTLEYDRAYALEMMGELEESLTGYRRIQEADPNFRDVRSRLGRLDQSSN